MEIPDKSAVAEQSQVRVVEMALPSSTSPSDKLLRRIATLLFILVAGLLTVFGYYASSICITVVLAGFLANFYDGLSLSADGKTITTVQSKAFRSFFSVPIVGATKKQPVQLSQTDKEYRYWASGSGGEIYVTGPGKLRRVKLDSQHTTDLMTDANGYFMRPQVCWEASNVPEKATPRYIIFELYGHGTDSGADRIWRIEPDGSNPVQLSSGSSDTAPACSPDGTSKLSR